MKNKIIEIQEYFRTKIVNGNFKTVKIDAHNVDIIVDGIYNFRIWIASGESYCEPSTHLSPCFIFLPKFSEPEKIKLFKKLKKVIADYNTNVVLVEKRAEYEKLKAELGI